jgi:hypothetical protein
MGTQSPIEPQFAPPVGAVSSSVCAESSRGNPVDRVSARRHSGVAETSAEAFHSLPVADYLQPKERAVLALFTGPDVRLSRQQIAEMARMPLCGCCGRVDSLRAKGELEEFGDRVDPATGKRQKTLQLPRPAQIDLVGEGS